jgi:hypothetical protein
MLRTKETGPGQRTGPDLVLTPIAVDRLIQGGGRQCAVAVTSDWGETAISLSTFSTLSTWIDRGPCYPEDCPSRGRFLPDVICEDEERIH